MAPLTSNRILIVEDDATVRRMMMTQLQRTGYQVEYAMSAEEVAPDERYDLVLTDVHLPGESGVELARKIRAAQPDQRIAFVTGDTDSGVARDAMGQGAAGYLVKPFELFELDAMVNNALGAPRWAHAHRHVTRPARVVLAPRKRRYADYAYRFRRAATVAAMIGVAWVTGYAIAPKEVEAPSLQQEAFSAGSKPMVIPIVMDKTVYLNNK